MPEFLKSAFVDGPTIAPGDVAVRLIIALTLGFVVSFIYRFTRKSVEFPASFPVTLVLLSVLIAMVTQVIGDNIARAFSLVGALAIVRFRTVVRDTQDTAYVIFAVVVGMAVGAKDLWVALIGLGIIGVGAFLMMSRTKGQESSQLVYLLKLRIGIEFDLTQLVGETLDRFLEERELLSVETAKQGSSLSAIYEVRLRPHQPADVIVKTLHRIEGVQSVDLRQRNFEER